MDENLKSLFDYTKFHIGLYTTLLTLLFTAISYGKADSVFLLKIVLVCFVVAGGFAGVVASNAYEFHTLKEFHATQLTAFGFKLWTGETCAHLEHLSFWIGIGVGVVGLLVQGHPNSYLLKYL